MVVFAISDSLEKFTAENVCDFPPLHPDVCFVEVALLYSLVRIIIGIV